MQIALNLVGNALKFTREGSIDVRLRAVDAGADRIELEVSDTGAGIPVDKLTAIFEPFAQANVSDSSLEGGAGLGLAIVRELARRMGGSVRVESHVGRGSTFIVDLFLVVDESGDHAPGPEDLVPTRPSAISPPVERRATPLSILVCEDNAINRRVIEAMLRRLGHTPTTVNDGAEAWERLQREKFDLLVTDVEMPIVDGVELTRRVRDREREESRPRMPIVGATAHVGEEEQHRLLDVGMDAHLAKPFTLAELSLSLRCCGDVRETVGGAAG